MSSNELNEADDAGSEQPLQRGPRVDDDPGQYRGRWGINAADCDQRRSDTKGAITIGERSMIFYESRAAEGAPPGDRDQLLGAVRLHRRRTDVGAGR